jgi:hypothetical protein
MSLTSIFELGVAEAYGLLTGRFGLVDLPPLDAIENEDWGRDYLLSIFPRFCAAELADAGLTLDDATTPPGPDNDAGIDHSEAR